MRVYTVDDEDIRSSGLVQVNDGLYAEVPLWCASGPIARRRIDLVCLEASVGRFRYHTGRTCTCVPRVSDCV
jgi:hypothetical protein